MGRLDVEGRTAMAVLLERGHSQSAVARLLGVTEGTVRYNRKRGTVGAVDGRSKQDLRRQRMPRRLLSGAMSRRMAGPTWRRCMTGFGASMVMTAV